MPGDILDQIDGALEDWTVSTDAMRWVPEEDRSEPREPRQSGRVWLRDVEWIELGYVYEDGRPLTTVPVRIAEAREAIRRAFDPLVESIRRLNDLTQDDFVLTAGRQPRDWREGETVKDRALRLRQNRNTGPAKVTARLPATTPLSPANSPPTTTHQRTPPMITHKIKKHLGTWVR